LVNGIWGTLAVGLFAEARFVADVGNGLFFGGGAKLLTAQAIGVVAVGGFVAVTSAVLWFAIRAIIGMRVDEEEEYLGLDRTEMGMEAYARDPMTTGAAETALGELGEAAEKLIPQPLEPSTETGE
jgi:Amt family ammonium transporter